MKLIKVLEGRWINLEQVCKVLVDEKYLTLAMADGTGTHVLIDSPDGRSLKKALGLK
jgi:hypothetical protein